MTVFLRTVWAIILTLVITACGDQTSAEERRRLGVAKECDAAVTSCTINDGDLLVSLTMGPGVIPLQPFPVTLAIIGKTAVVDSVVVDFQMQGMAMGTNRYRLQQEENRWQGTVILPVCTASRTDWQAIVEFTLDGEPVMVAFPFQTRAN